MGETLHKTPRDEAAHFAVAQPFPSGYARSPPAKTPSAPVMWPTLWRAWARQLALRCREMLRDAGTREYARGTAFLWAPIFLGAGSLAYIAASLEPSFYAILSGAGLLVIALIVTRSRSHENLVPLLLLQAALISTMGFAFAKWETYRAGTSMLGAEITTRLTGRVVGIEMREGGRVRVTLDVLETRRPKLRYAPDRVRLTARNVPADLRPGETIAGLARLMPPSGPVRPHAYDFSFASYFAGRGAVGFFLRDPQRTEQTEPLPYRLRATLLLQQMRERLADRVRGAIKGTNGEIAVALITGLRAGIPEETNEALRRAGLAHVLAISGLHMALVAFTFIGTARLALAFFPSLVARHPVRKYAAAAALAVCFLYLLISGLGVAAQRSFIMLAVMLAALIFDRAALTMRNLAIAALIVLAVSPHEVVGPGFQMSFAATAALIAGYAVWNRRRERRFARREGASRGARRGPLRLLLFYAAGLALTSLIAGTATALYGAWHFQRASPLALGANLAAMPFVSLIVMPGALLGVATMPFGLDAFAFKAMDHGISAVLSIAHWFSERTPFDATGSIPLSSTLLLTLALALFTLTTTRLRWLALPFALAGFAVLAGRELPPILISEDARLIAIRTSDGAMAVNRKRPNAFNTENWQRAMQADRVVKPSEAKGAETLPSKGLPIGEGFHCRDKLCVARHHSGALVAHLDRAGAVNRDTIGSLCQNVDLLIVNDATIGRACKGKRATLVTRRDLARRGAALVRVESTMSKGFSVKIAHAIGEPYRPWHAHRQYQRAARGLPPYARKKKQGPPSSR